MSINFENPMNDETRRLAETMFKGLVAMDEKTILINDCTLFQPDFKKLVNASGQIVEVEMHDKGDIKKMSDGTRYQMTIFGWKKLN